MLQKFLLIGVGGSGGKTLRYTWRELDRRLKATGWTEGVPIGWQFLHIDVPEKPDVIEGDVPVEMGESARYVGLGRQPRLYREYDNDLVSRPELFPAIAGWRPDPTQDYAAPFRGAGQRRVVGRVVALTQLGQVGEALSASVSAMSSARVEEQMVRLNTHLQITDVHVNAEPATAVVFSSLGGGSGSGMFLDIIELLMARRTEQTQWLADSLVTVLYASDVFGHLGGGAKPGIEPNSLAAISELLSGYEHEGEVPDIESTLLDRGGGSTPIVGRRVGRTNFVIGVRNELVKFETSSDVFRSVGKAFAAFMTNQDVQRQFATYISTNPSAPTVTDAFAVTDQDSANRPCSSFGYANVSLGRSLFAQYAAERLAKRGLERLLRGHLEQQQDYVREDVAIAQRAESLKETFFSDCGLWEIGSDNNQVLDAFRSIADVKAGLDRVKETIRSELRERANQELSPQDWYRSLSASVDEAGRAFLQEQEQRRSTNATNWIAPIQHQVLRVVAGHTGRYGIPVTLGLLQLLVTQLREAAAELDQDAHRFATEEAGLLARTQQLFETSRERKLTPKHQSFGQAVDYRRDALQRRSEADLYTFAATVIRDLVEGFVPAVASSLRGGEQTLRRSEQGEHKNLVEQWSATSVPSHLRAAPNELLLEKEDDFPGRLDDLLIRTMSIEAADDALSAALEEVVSGAWPSIYDNQDTFKRQSLIALTAEWAPQLSAARAPDRTPQKAACRMDLDPASLLDRSSRWVRERRGPMTQFVSETLSDWLSDTHVQAAERADRFVGAMGQAIGSARPLVSINQDTYRDVHGLDLEPPRLLLTPIPIDAQHRARQRVEQRLVDAGVPQSEVGGLFQVNAKVAEVEITSFIARSVHPIVFDSVFGPVLRDWQNRTTEPERTQFWTYRRARNLTGFVPLSPSRQDALYRGWFIANALGQVPRLEDSWSRKPLDIWTREGRQPFPRYLLRGDVTQMDWVPAALFESLPLAFLSFGARQPGELKAYLRLIELGTFTGVQDGSPVLNEELLTWLRKGEVAQDLAGNPAPDPPVELAGSASDSFEQRKQTFLTQVVRYEQLYREHVGGRRVQRDTLHQLGPEWEIRDLVSRSLRSLADATEHVRAVGGFQGIAGEGTLGAFG